MVLSLLLDFSMYLLLAQTEQVHLFWAFARKMYRASAELGEGVQDVGRGFGVLPWDQETNIILLGDRGLTPFD